MRCDEFPEELDVLDGASVLRFAQPVPVVVGELLSRLGMLAIEAQRLRQRRDGRRRLLH